MGIRDRITELRRVRAVDLRANPANWRTHPAGQRAALESVLGEVGYAAALIARETPAGLELIDGHLRAGLDPEQVVPVLVVDVDEAEAKLLLATLDPLASMAEASAEKLAQLMAEVEIKSADLKAAIEDLAVPEVLVVNDSVDAEPQTDRATELQAKWCTAANQLWLIGKHRLLCGDSTKAEDVSRVMGGENWRLCVTSPPYNQRLDTFKPSGMHTETHWVKNVQSGSYADSKDEPDYQSEQIEAIAAWLKCAAADASIFYNHKNRYRSKEVVSPWNWLAKTGLKVRQEIIWNRGESVTQNARMFMPCDERIFWMYDGKDFYFDDTTEHKTWSSVWEIGSHKDREQSLHGCAFPMEIATRPIAACSKKEDIVFEPYLGSGTTLIAAENLGRRCYGIEISPQYVAVILQRYADAFPDQQIRQEA